MNKVYSIIVLFFTTFCFSQNIDTKKVEKIGNILCNCLEDNISKNIEERVNDCGYVLTEGLSVIKSDSIRNVYAQKSDTYLQKNCLSYIKMIIDANPNSDISISKDFSSLKGKSISIDSDLKEKFFFYNDFIGDTIYVSFKENNLVEESSLTKAKTYFFIQNISSNSQLVFLNSEDSFFNDYYNKTETIDFFFLKENKDLYSILLKYSNGIILKKNLHTTTNHGSN